MTTGMPSLYAVGTLVLTLGGLLGRTGIARPHALSDSFAPAHKLGPRDKQRLMKAAREFARRVAGQDESRFVQVYDEALIAAVKVRSTEPLTGLRSGNESASVLEQEARMSTILAKDPMYAKHAAQRLEHATPDVFGGEPVVPGSPPQVDHPLSVRHRDDPTDPGYFPDCVAVGTETSLRGGAGCICSGVLVAPNRVVTAGHCLDPNLCPVAPTHVLIDFRTGSSAQLVPIKKPYAQTRIQHPNYSRVGRRTYNDLSVLILERNVDVSARPIASSAFAESMVMSGAETFVMGYGSDSSTGTGGLGQKRIAHIILATPDESLYGCDPGLEIVGKPPAPGQLTPDSCSGDSGGPLYAWSGSAYVVVGATSRAVRPRDPLNDPACGVGGIYTRLDRYATWILTAGTGAGH